MQKDELSCNDVRNYDLGYNDLYSFNSSICVSESMSFCVHVSIVLLLSLSLSLLLSLLFGGGGVGGVIEQVSVVCKECEDVVSQNYYRKYSVFSK